MPEQTHSYDWLVLNPRGTVSINVPDDDDNDNWVHLRMAKIGDIRKFGLWVEDADEALRLADAKIRADIGMNESTQALLQELRRTDASMEAVAQAPDAFKLEADYMGALQRFILGPDNPYPPIYAGVLSDLGGREFEPGSLPGFALTQPPLTLIIAHWQLAPLSADTGSRLRVPPPGAPVRAKPRR